jgi:hypothetical protein
MMGTKKSPEKFLHSRGISEIFIENIYAKIPHREVRV